MGDGGGQASPSAPGQCCLYPRPQPRLTLWPLGVDPRPSQELSPLIGMGELLAGPPPVPSEALVEGAHGSNT